MAKIEPAVTQLLYIVPDGTSYIDLAKDLSKVNRRLYRQGMTYAVQDVQIGLSVGMRPSDIQQFTFHTSGNSWIVHNAWKKAYHSWRAQTREVVKALGPIEGKWADFKVYLDDTMRTGTTLEPYASDAAAYTGGDWGYSQFVWDDDGTERESYAHLIGGDVGTTDFALIQNYADARPRVQDPDPMVEGEASTSMYAKMMTLGDDEFLGDLIDNIENTNDSPPYDADEYPGGSANADATVPVRFGAVSAAQSVGTMPGFIVPCGLIKIHTSEAQLDDTIDITAADASTINAPGPTSVYSTGSAANTAIIITVAPGPYRGVLAMPMGQ